MSAGNFAKVSKLLSENREKHEKQVKEFCVNLAVCPFEEFLRGYAEEAKVIDEGQQDNTIVSNNCSIHTFKEIFQDFEKYPPNLHKPKKQVFRDFNRTLSTNRSQSSSVTDLAIDKMPATEKWEKGPEAAEIYNNYRKFLKIAKELQDISKSDLEQKYVDALQKIHVLAKNVEKLQDDQIKNADVAFSKDDAELLAQFNSYFEKALYINENQNLFKIVCHNEQTFHNILNVTELLDYCFEKIGNLRDN